MASFDQTAYPSFPVIYNVSSSVGRGGSNAPDDVALVQWLLHRVYTDSSLFSPPEDTDIAIDGYIGPHTLLWIGAFQNDICGLGIGCATDGRVDSARVGIFMPTIVWLNGFCAQANPALFDNPASDGDLSAGWGWANKPQSLGRIGWRRISPLPWVKNPPDAPNVGMGWINNPPAKTPFRSGVGMIWTNPALPSRWHMPGPIGIHWYKTKGHFASYLVAGGATYQINAPGGDNSYVDRIQLN
jgi:hypothetical protein